MAVEPASTPEPAVSVERQEHPSRFARFFGPPGPWRRFPLALAFSLIGGTIGHFAGLPAPWLAGAGLAVAIAAAAGAKVAVPSPARAVAFTIIGISMGSGVGPDTLGRAAAWPVSLAGLAIAVVGMTLASAFYLRRVHGFDADTAKLSSIPGALSSVIAVAESGYGDARRVITLQAVRLLGLTVLLPTLLSGLPSGDIPTPPDADAFGIVALLAAGGAGALAMRRTGLPAAELLGGLIVSAMLHLTGLVPGRLPDALVAGGFVVTAAVMGSRFAGVGRRELSRDLLAGLGALAVATAVAAAVGAAVAWGLDLPLAQLLISYAPGGLEAMGAMALILGVDTAFVAVHHLCRFLGLAFAVPLWLGRKSLRER